MAEAAAGLKTAPPAGGMSVGRLRGKPGASRRKKRVGMGSGSGRGKTCGRGHKGQKAHSRRPAQGFEGGQMPLVRRIPKRGFTSINRKEFRTVNVGRLEIFDNGEEVGAGQMESRGLIRAGKTPVKVLGGGSLTKSVTVKAERFSSGAVEKIEAAGGKAVKC